MKLLRLIPLALVALIASCGGEDETVYDEQQEDAVLEVDHDEFLQECNDLKKKIEDQMMQPMGVSDDLREEAVVKFQDFQGFFPDDPEAPHFLHQASDHAYFLGQVEKAIKIMEKLENDYPDYEGIEDVVYLKAVYYDMDLRDTTKAKECYQDYLDRYPDSGNRSADAQIRIKYIQYSVIEYGEMIANGEIEPIVQ